MIINSSILRYFFITSFVLIFPLIQKQWFNLYLFNTNSINFYSFLYYVSGLIFPLLVLLNSINNFTIYNFNKKNKQIKKVITGKLLFILILFILIPLSILTYYYFFLNLDLLLKSFFEISFQSYNVFVFRPYLLFVFSFLLILKKSRIILKKVILVNFFSISLITWHTYIQGLSLSDKVDINYFSKFINFNFINIILLLTIELLYYVWSFISYNQNLSDWSIPRPHVNEIRSIYKILIFYLIIFVYYFLIQ